MTTLNKAKFLNLTILYVSSGFQQVFLISVNKLTTLVFSDVMLYHNWVFCDKTSWVLDNFSLQIKTFPNTEKYLTRRCKIIIAWS